MKIPKPTWELVVTQSRGRTFFGFCKRGSETTTLVGESKREAMRVIHALYYGEPYIPVDGESHNVVETDEIASSEALTANTEDLNEDTDTDDLDA